MLIRIKNIKCETILGFYAFEKNQKVPVIINVSLEYDAGRSPQTDNMEDTLNYHPIVNEICAHVNNTNFNLVEKVVEDVGQIVLKHDKVYSCEIEVDKVKAPVPEIDSFSVSKKFRKSSNWFPII